MDYLSERNRERIYSFVIDRNYQDAFSIKVILTLEAEGTPGLYISMKL
jgi:hypothetical protein